MKSLLLSSHPCSFLSPRPPASTQRCTTAASRSTKTFSSEFQQDTFSSSSWPLQPCCIMAYACPFLCCRGDMASGVNLTYPHSVLVMSPLSILSPVSLNLSFLICKMEIIVAWPDRPTIKIKEMNHKGLAPGTS